MDGTKSTDVLAAKEAERRAAEKKAKKARDRQAKAAPRRVYLTQDNMRIAYLAGSGKSGGEIAEAIGATTRHRIRALLSRFGLPLVGRNPDERVVVVTLPAKALDRVTHAADERSLDPLAVVAAIVAAVASEPSLLRNLLDEEA